MDLNMKVLIVDDHLIMRRIVRALLKQIGITHISEEDNGNNAIIKLKKEKFDLILCDWMMPEMPGIELLKKVRSDDELKDIPFIMVTANNQEANVIEAVNAEVSSYIVKPLTAKILRKKLKEIFGG